MKHTIEVFSPLLGSFGFDGTLDELKNVGLTNLDLNLGAGLWSVAQPGEKPLEIPAKEIEKRAEGLKAQAAAKGVTLSTVSCFVDFEKPEMKETIKRCLKIGQVVGATTLVTGSGQDPAAAIPALKDLGRYADTCGLNIAMETHPPMGHNAVYSLWTLMDVKHPRIKLNYDTANIYYYNHKIDGEAELRKLIQHVGHLHIKDSRKGFHENFFPALGDGVIDLRKIFDILDEAGFKGNASIEIEGPAALGEAATPENIRKALKRSVEHLAKVGVI
ncbi:MAG: hypothetical protein A3K19_18050 [Lentisphaerae bacterium RIFOXYB12_FULL_65_16]|nr:MAG: hypothetical protein A3K18_12635 [Lentisphaerae bacterium RIFOXYA12_64_32]OGV87081.1 MAG: hypothetical protein A3K19_18050 [Lentisphaerae bacterium RIFOXYB12_FULL_65_16]